MAASVPQVVRIIRARTSAGVSMRLWQLTAATTAAWAAHGFLVGSLQMQIPNVLTASLALGILIFVLRDRKQAIFPQLVIASLIAAALVSIDMWQGALAFGLIVAVPQLFGQASQLRALLNTPDPAGVSAPFLGVFALGQMLWFAYGITFNDWALMVVASSMSVIALINLVVCLIRQARARVTVAA